MRLSIPGLLLALSAALVPIIGVPIVHWSRAEYIARHPDKAAKVPVTISRAVADAGIYDIAVVTAIPISIMYMAIILVIAFALLRTNRAVFAGDRWRQKVANQLIYFGIAAQVIASAGLVTAAQYTNKLSKALHMAGTYGIFGGEALVILVLGIVSGMVLNASRPAGFISDEGDFFMGRTLLAVRRLAAYAIFALTMIHWVFFCIKGLDLPFSNFLIRSIYVTLEAMAATLFLCFLPLFIPELYRTGAQYSFVDRSRGLPEAVKD